MTEHPPEITSCHEDIEQATLRPEGYSKPCRRKWRLQTRIVTDYEYSTSRHAVAKLRARPRPIGSIREDVHEAV